jgi:hypothetical protein
MSAEGEQRLERMAAHAGYGCVEDLKAALRSSKKAIHEVETAAWNRPKIAPITADLQNRNFLRARSRIARI